MADGYGNSRVVAFNPEGVFLRMYGGEYGTGPRQINCAHNCAYAEVRGISNFLRWSRCVKAQVLSAVNTGQAGGL